MISKIVLSRSVIQEIISENNEHFLLLSYGLSKAKTYKTIDRMYELIRQTYTFEGESIRQPDNPDPSD